MKYFFKTIGEVRNAFYVCLNQSEAYAPEEIRRKSVCMNEDIGEVLKEL
jgi:hypothetical protein